MIRSLLKSLLVLVVLAGLLLAVYAFFVEPVWLKVQTVPIKISATQGKVLRFAHVSDFHWGGAVSSRYLKHAFATIAAQRPDAILITGDFVARTVRDPAAYAEALKTLSAAAPTYAVGGNHDGGVWARHEGGYATTDTVRSILAAAGIRYLENEFVCPELKSLKVCIGGLGDFWAGLNGQEVFSGAYDSIRADLKIMLLHNPDAKTLVRKDDWDLMLAGHTHGGQIVLPFIGAPWTPVLDKSHIRGLFQYDGRPVYITPGIGSSEHRARFNCRPEVSMLEVAL